MKITINTNPNIEDVEVAINCNHITPEVERLVSIMHMMDMQLTGKKDDETFVIAIKKVLYIETVDKKTFIYTKEDVYETNLRLYELEERLLKGGFFRANKSCIINLRRIVSLKSGLDRRILVTMSNDEKLIVSRQYAEDFKKKLEVR